MAIAARAYESDADLRLMQALQQELWAIEGKRTHAHVGDLAWWATQHVGREAEWKRRLWLDGDRCVAWAWLDRPASLDYEVHPEHRGGALHGDVLDWFESAAEGDGRLTAWCMDGDGVSLELLTRRGYALPADGDSYLYYVRELAEPIPVPPLPEGFRLRTVAGERDLDARVLVHQAVWAPSRVTEESYRNVMRTWPYRAELDCVLEAPDGSFAAYVLCWYDEANRVGEFEPVGTHPNLRRRGFGAAVCLYALRRLQEEGAAEAVVYASGREDQRQASALYESVGFRRHTRMLELRRTRT
jgi:ribosomal protein S18 acetylase RimI-like enzyme